MENNDLISNSKNIINVNEETFISEVVEASKTVPVIVDFWAPWCEPCKTLTPLLEDAVKGYGQELILAKIDIDQNQNIATQLRIQSIPTIYTFFEGKVVRKDILHEVKKGTKGSHRGIASNIEINENGINHPLYKNKDKKFNTPAFNFDEVVTMPENSILLASNPINNVQGINFKVGNCNIWGLQYHPEITYHKMITLIKFRKDRLINVRKCFKDEKEIHSIFQDNFFG